MFVLKIINMNILSGKQVAASIKDEIKRSVESLPEDIRPTLACIIVGNNPASQSYVRSKVKSCNECGISSHVIELPEETTEVQLKWEIARLNADKSINGIIVQLPLPKHINESNIINYIRPEKDVDGFHVVNQGKLVVGDNTGFVPATPLGITKIFDYYNIDCDGKKCVILGRSNIVGKPMAQLMLQRNASVTILHSHSIDKYSYLKDADIVILAIGHPNFISSYILKQDAVVIDVGINRVPADNEKGYKIVGDFDICENYDGFEDSRIQYTPVPGGVGLTTVASLLYNTLKAFETQTR